MTTQVIYVTGEIADVEKALRAIPREAVKRGKITDAMMVRCGMAALGRIRKAFIDKARGGTDEAGLRWAPLKPTTIAYGRRHKKKPGNPRESQLFSRAKKLPYIPRPKIRAGYAPSYALTNRQRDRWWLMYSQGLAIFKGDKASAARRAWAILKREGATTIIEQYGDAQVDILRDTGLLLNSLSPGATTPQQIFRVRAGMVIVGTNRKWAGTHHRGIPGRLPQRRLWPEPARWPASWWDDIAEQARMGLIDLAVYLITEKGKT